MHQPNLRIKIKNVEFPNPVLVASGTFGYAKEFEKFFALKTLGGIVTKTITIKPRIGNAPYRVVETPGGMLNAIGLQNVGAEKFVQDKLPYLRKLGVPVIVSVMGYSLEEFEQVLTYLDSHSGIDGYELNLSCPNVKYGSNSETVKMFAHDANMITDAVKVARKATRKLVIAKLGPDVSDIAAMAKAAEAGGADAVSLINTFRAMVINVQTRKPVLGNLTGGLSGPCVRPIAIRMTYDVHRAVKIPVIGMGGIATAKDAIEFLLAGASLVQVGTMNFVNPTVCPEILKGIQTYCKKNKIQDIRQVIGQVVS